MTLSPFRIAVTACLTAFAGLVGAKLAGLIGWSWWWIAAPVWAPAAAAGLCAVIGLAWVKLTWPGEDDPDMWH